MTGAHHRVTSVIADLDDGYRYVNDASMEYARLRGTAVHRATELYDLGTLDEDSLDPIIVPYLEAYKAFRRETGFEPTQIELRLVHPSLGYTGMLDRVGKIKHRKILLDLKAVAAIQKATRIQIAAYAELCMKHSILIDERRALQLRPDGSYRLSEPYISGDDLRVFVSLLTIKNWRDKNG